MPKREISHEEYVRILGELIEEEGRDILTIEGVYEVLSEHFNNDILDIWDESESVRIQDEQTAYERERGY